ncbi:hypothetical protein LCGC14_1498760 [marine sediment metagenome]|uniref:Uncharacterized protein n=1 Tax=marine sediment metagenome TaxID=412755 RepID=A0A0F9M636_9ZZZZ
MNLADVIRKYEEELKAHQSGAMMSMAEAAHGEVWCDAILADLRQLQESPYIRWIDYGKAYGQLVRDLEQIGESIVGIQVNFAGSHRYPALCPKGQHLVGDIDADGGGAGEEYLAYVIVTRYRRLLTAEELNE